MKVKNEQGENVDWWFIYKLPVNVGTESDDGGKYLYYDDETSLELSPHELDKKQGALYATLTEIFSKKDANQGYIIYNDENPDGDSDQEQRGHCKGILAFNKKADTAIILLHSVPRFPYAGELDLPTKELKYGQTFICIELSGYNVAEQFANQMLTQQNPQVNVNDSLLPTNIDKDESIYKLYHRTDIDESKTPSTFDFKSRNGKSFKMIAKSKAWHDDFWIDAVAPNLGVDLDVESWRRGAVTASKDNESNEIVEDVIEIDLSKIGLKGFYWKYTQDHSKWAVTAKGNEKKGKWVCIADINRMISQEKRGGGGICFKEPKLWESLIQILPELKLEK